MELDLQTSDEIHQTMRNNFEHRVNFRVLQIPKHLLDIDLLLSIEDDKFPRMSNTPPKMGEGITLDKLSRS
jgi:hypothetical protein